MADIPRSVAEEMLFGLGVYGAGAAAAPRLKALGTKLATKVFPPKAPAKRAPPAKPVLALPAPPPKLKPESYVDLIEKADRRLQGKAARAVSDFVGHEAGTYARGEGSGFGLMMPDALESAFAVDHAKRRIFIQMAAGRPALAFW